jgi:DNA-binding beta-propeller fold protein YncE|nr:c-type cytochrome [Kofleriaceae bacterium]
MRPRKLALGLTAALVPTLTFVAYSHAKRVVGDFETLPVSFQIFGRPLGAAKPANATAAHLSGSRIAAAGDGAIVIDADSGSLLRTDAKGNKVAELAIGKNAGLLTYDDASATAFVADRMGDRVVAVKVGDKSLEQTAVFKTPAEPYGVALSPDRHTLLVSTIADRTLVALDAVRGGERWRTALGREPRNVAISPDGTRALVAYIATGTVDQIDLLETHRAEHIALSTQSSHHCRRCGNDTESFARAAYTVAFMGDHQAVVPFQRETPVQQNDGAERTGSYGGGFESPVEHELAFLGFGNAQAQDSDDAGTQQVLAQIAEHQPRAIAWDDKHDALYVAGMGTDSLLQVQNASSMTIGAGLETALTTGDSRCGPDGLAIDKSGNVLVWCSFTRNVERIDMVDAQGQLAAASKVSPGAQLVASAMTTDQHEGLVLFHSAEAQISARGAMACASCHPDVRDDGLSWRIDKRELQTPLLAGRVAGTHPYKWDGGDPDLKTSLTSTMKRLGGFGLDAKQTEALAAYLEAVPKVRTPTQNTEQVARGGKVFDEVGCRSCHDGAMYTDQEKHKLSGTLPETDTPSLVGLAASAPYFHDGSAATLEALLRDRGAVHGMAETAKLSDKQIDDLTAFLQTL